MKVLILCTGNSCRRKNGAGVFSAYSDFFRNNACGPVDKQPYSRKSRRKYLVFHIRSQYGPDNNLYFAFPADKREGI